jgi:hypothetical protein
MYRRLIQIIGVDINTNDGSLYKHPEDQFPAAMHICHQGPQSVNDEERIDIDSLRVNFEKPYVFALSRIPDDQNN